MSFERSRMNSDQTVTELSDSEHDVDFSAGPYTPNGAIDMPDISSLSTMKQTLSSAELNTDISTRISSMINDWSTGARVVEPYIEMRNILEDVRQVPSGPERVWLMNSVVRTLGRPALLATFLDMLRDSTLRDGTEEQAASKAKLQNVKMHSIYGWSGNTLMVETSNEPTEGTFMNSAEGLAKRLGNSALAWNMTVHVWQPNTNAQGFEVPQIAEGSIHEPPHSHPFNFVSTIVKGRMRQSIYEQAEQSSASSEVDTEGVYNHTTLEHVDSVWPPHYFRETTTLDTREHRVELNEGESYYMPCNWIHDVEIDEESASTKPAISLFLSSEYLVMPHVYMTSSMADYHRNNPEIKRAAAPIPEEAWHRKLQAISAYLRDEVTTLNLNEIVDFQGEYAFFHRNNIKK